MHSDDFRFFFTLLIIVIHSHTSDLLQQVQIILFFYSEFCQPLNLFSVKKKNPKYKQGKKNKTAMTGISTLLCQKTQLSMNELSEFVVYKIFHSISRSLRIVSALFFSIILENSRPGIEESSQSSVLMKVQWGWNSQRQRGSQSLGFSCHSFFSQPLFCWGKAKNRGLGGGYVSTNTDIHMMVKVHVTACVSADTQEENVLRRCWKERRDSGEKRKITLHRVEWQ